MLTEEESFSHLLVYCKNVKLVISETNP